MQLSFIHLFLLSAVPTVFACEGECIVGITNAFLEKYKTPVFAVLTTVAKQLDELTANPEHNSPFTKYFSSFVHAYQNESYAGMESAIFPSYFHGKCQRDGVDPPGCPNPDCPVVCGTPGSLVHFYPKLCDITFAYIRKILEMLATPGSGPYRQVEQAALAAASKSTPRVYPRSLSRYLAGDDLPPSKRSDLASLLPGIMKDIPSSFEKACGHGDMQGPSKCSQWETSMKTYILSFP